MEIVRDVQSSSYTELPTRALIGPESDDSDRMTSKNEAACAADAAREVVERWLRNG
jgi:hypothetical protein